MNNNKTEVTAIPEDLANKTSLCEIRFDCLVTMPEVAQAIKGLLVANDWGIELVDEYIKTDDSKPYISDDFQIGPDGAFEYTEDEMKEFSEWDVTLNDGLEDE